jgi:hypothetical protein
MTVPADLDVASMPDEVRGELSRLLGDEQAGEAPPTGEQGSGTQQKPAEGAETKQPESQQPPVQTAQQSKDEEPPAWAKDLLQSNRVLQGQVRAFEAQIRQQPQASQPTQQRAPDAIDKLLEQVDQNDPTVVALAQAVQGLRAQVNQLGGAVQTSQMSAQEQATRQAWEDYFENMAQDAGVGFDSIRNQLRHVPTGEMATVGAKAVIQAAKGTGKDPAPQQAPDVEKIKAEAVRDALTKLGLYDNLREGLAGLGERDLDAIERKLDQFNSNPDAFSVEDLEKLTAGLR